MADDLVEQLRRASRTLREAGVEGVLLADVAADEIERLRAEVARWHASFKGHVYVGNAEYITMRDETDRLRESLGVAETRATMYADERDRYRAALERLKEYAGSPYGEARKIINAALAGGASNGETRRA